MNFESEDCTSPLKARTDDPMVPIKSKKFILMPDIISGIRRPTQGCAKSELWLERV